MRNVADCLVGAHRDLPFEQRQRLMRRQIMRRQIRAGHRGQGIMAARHYGNWDFSAFLYSRLFIAGGKRVGFGGKRWRKRWRNRKRRSNASGWNMTWSSSGPG